jgi:hypothetical protein
VYEPQRTTLAIGRDQGKEWRVVIDVWGAPRDETEAQGQIDSMAEYGTRPADVRVAKDLVGKGWVFVRRTVGDGDPSTVVQGPIEKGDTMSGTDIQAYSMPLEAGDSQRLVIGKVAPTAQQVMVTWDNDKATVVGRAPRGADFNTDDAPAIRTVDGSQPNWFVCLALEGAAYESVEVTG